MSKLIRIKDNTQKSLIGMKDHPRETYDDVVMRLVRFKLVSVEDDSTLGCDLIDDD